MSQQAREVASGERFEFGKNWRHFLATLDEDRICQSEISLQRMLDLESLSGRSFLDIGCGSGLFSLAARRLGATVFSFDYDPHSVACASELRRRYFPDDPDWTVQPGSVLDRAYLSALGQFDIVYSWGVLHHTGEMWQALDNVCLNVCPGGLLYIAIYNDKGRESVRWRKVKKLYCALPSPLRPLLAVASTVPRDAKHIAKSLLRLRPQEYVYLWTRYRERRGMSRWHDIVDWVGGYPYEYAKPEEILGFYAKRGFAPMHVKRTNGIGCNEFVMRHAPGVAGADNEDAADAAQVSAARVQQP